MPKKSSFAVRTAEELVDKCKVRSKATVSFLRSFFSHKQTIQAINGMIVWCCMMRAGIHVRICVRGYGWLCVGCVSENMSACEHECECNSSVGASVIGTPTFMSVHVRTGCACKHARVLVLCVCVYSCTCKRMH